MRLDDEPEQAQQSFFKRFRVAIIVTAALIAGIIAVAKLASSGRSSKRDTLMLVSIAPPPPPPPVMTPPQQPPPEQQKIEEPMIKEEAPKAAPPKDEPPLGTGIKGPGSDGFGLGSNPGNGRIGGGGDGSKWGWYASQVQSRIQKALQQNRKTRTASMSINVRIWPDPNGGIRRAQLAGSTGDPSLDSALRDEVLSRLQLPEPPPAGMPAPITLRVTAKRPR
jgi:TonB family protein